MDEAAAGPMMNDDDILARLRQIARTELELRPDQIERIQMETSIVHGLQLDSLKQVILLTSIEETFGFEMSPDDRQALQELTTVGDLVRLVRARSSKSPT